MVLDFFTDFVVLDAQYQSMHDDIFTVLFCHAGPDPASSFSLDSGFRRNDAMCHCL